MLVTPLIFSIFCLPTILYFNPFWYIYDTFTANFTNIYKIWQTIYKTKLLWNLYLIIHRLSYINKDVGNYLKKKKTISVAFLYFENFPMSFSENYWTIDFYDFLIGAWNCYTVFMKNIIVYVLLRFNLQLYNTDGRFDRTSLTNCVDTTPKLFSLHRTYIT